MDFFMKLAAKHVSQDSALRKVRALIDWQRLAAVLGPVRSRPGRAAAMSIRWSGFSSSASGIRCRTGNSSGP